MASAVYLICWISPDGEEREERWPSPDRFRAWAAANGVRATYTAYREDEDGDWVVVDKGRLGR